MCTFPLKFDHFPLSIIIQGKKYTKLIPLDLFLLAGTDKKKWTILLSPIRDRHFLPSLSFGQGMEPAHCVIESEKSKGWPTVVTYVGQHLDPESMAQKCGEGH